MRCVSIALAIVVLYYGMEEWITAGRMSRSVLVAAGSVGKVHPADWFAAGNLLLVLIWKCVGLILLTGGRRTGDGIGPASARHGSLFVIAGTDLDRGRGGAGDPPVFHGREVGSVGLLLLGLLVVIAVVIPACALLEKIAPGRTAGRGPLGLLGGRAGSHGGRSGGSARGGWFNYALQAVVIACVLTAPCPVASV